MSSLTLTESDLYSCSFSVNSFVTIQLTVNPALWANRQLSFMVHFPPIPFVFIQFDMCSPMSPINSQPFLFVFPLAYTGHWWWCSEVPSTVILTNLQFILAAQKGNEKEKEMYCSCLRFTRATQSLNFKPWRRCSLNRNLQRKALYQGLPMPSE